MNNQNKLSKILGMIFGIIGSVFFILGVAALAYNFYSYSSQVGDQAFLIVGSVFSIIGGIFLIIGSCALLISLSQKRKALRLMRDGKSYDADIVRIYDKPYTHINYRNPFVVECGYRDNRGTSYLVKSGNVWPNTFMTRESDIKARVWVNPDNPKDYYVEVYTDSSKAKTDTKFDFDYR